MGSRLDDPSNESEDLPTGDDQFTQVFNSLIKSLTARPDDKEDYRYIDESSRERVLEEIYSDPRAAEDAFYLFNIAKLRATVRLFLENFLPDDPHRKVAYAVKANPHREVLKVLIEEGVDCMDCASVGEIRRIVCLDFDRNSILYNHPIKKRRDIYDAYHEFGVRHFTVQTKTEVSKILSAAMDLDQTPSMEIAVRMRTDNPEATINLSQKFGAYPEEVYKILNLVKELGLSPGISVHTGSQNPSQKSYIEAIRTMSKVAGSVGGVISFNVGGGIPVNYFYYDNFDTAEYLKTISDAISVEKSKNPAAFAHEHRVIIEVGRALVASSMDLVVPIVSVSSLDDAQVLHLSDGIFGSFFDYSVHGWRYNFRALNADHNIADGVHLSSYTLRGPTKTLADRLNDPESPFRLPPGLTVGDRLIVENAGAYMYSVGSRAMKRPSIVGYNDLLF